ncbi:hypothetical protein [Geodermatophilus normandii]|uniref:Uncharacterized protein n=1 Tax=Geodermatophilus normandii TaxID=1137989 RepID=A0A6P0GI89_9ACTN|nr:hypothetical protein [Geodermatophilus normandii]NEM06998.1 hypothetical protein [Geodermatophilus normandii]
MQDGTLTVIVGHGLGAAAAGLDGHGAGTHDDVGGGGQPIAAGGRVDRAARAVAGGVGGGPGGGPGGSRGSGG